MPYHQTTRFGGNSRGGNNRGGGRASYPTQSRNRGGRRAQYIDPSKFVRVAKMREDTPYEAEHRFADFAINELLKSNIAAKGFTTPSPIQDQTIPLALEGRDVIGIANTGTGKTAAFGIPLIDGLMAGRNKKVLIIAPTRELAEQIRDELRTLGMKSGLSAALLIGGDRIGPQFRQLDFNPKIIIGTPGRIKDHLERGTLRLRDCDTVVLDEVDRMLDMGFVDDITEILAELATPRQSLFFSATIDNRVRNLIEQFSTNPVSISVKSSDSSDSVHQDVVEYDSTSQKIDKLHDILNSNSVAKVIVFDETKHSVERLSEELLARGFKSDAIHGGKSQPQRQRALRRFKQNEVNVLVATDVAARGIDVSDITHVINYSLPQSYDDYVHRIGRAGRAGKIGYALTFVQSRQRY